MKYFSSLRKHFLLIVSHAEKLRYWHITSEASNICYLKSNLNDTWILWFCLDSLTQCECHPSYLTAEMQKKRDLFQKQRISEREKYFFKCWKEKVLFEKKWLKEKKTISTNPYYQCNHTTLHFQIHVRNLKKENWMSSTKIGAMCFQLNLT